MGPCIAIENGYSTRVQTGEVEPAPAADGGDLFDVGGLDQLHELPACGGAGQPSRGFVPALKKMTCTRIGQG